jgi:hypothetical protein
MNLMSMRLIGVQPLMQSNPVMANPLHPLARQVSAITGKRKKTEEDHLQIQYLKWLGSLYYDDEIGPYLPEDHLWSALEAAAKMTKEGPSIRQGLMIIGKKFPILYNGPRDIAGMYSDPDGRFVDVRDANASGRKIQASRVIFPHWECDVEFSFDPQVLDFANLKRIAEICGLRVGCGTYRKKFGRFRVAQCVDHGSIDHVAEAA